MSEPIAGRIIGSSTVEFKPLLILQTLHWITVSDRDLHLLMGF
jgi:hypothetical protein